MTETPIPPKSVPVPGHPHRVSALVCAVLGIGVLAAGCTSTVGSEPFFGRHSSPNAVSMYAAMPEERFPIPAVNLARVESRYYRRVVDYKTKYRPGTVIVDTPHRYLYFVMPGGRAMRYGIGIGKAGFVWNGSARIAAKRPWPIWTPPKEMIVREPYLEKFAKGMPPGIDNPLGARALYIYKNGRDTLYRLHGTSEAHTIGKAVSSGCIRLMHHDVIDLYERVQPGARIVVLDHALIDLRLSGKFLRDAGDSIMKRISDIRRDL